MSIWEPAQGCGWHRRAQETQPGEVCGRACPVPRGKPPTSLEGTAQPRLAVPLVVTDGPIAAFGGCFGAVTPDTQLVSTALSVPGADLQRGGKHNSPPAHDLGEPVTTRSPESLKVLQVGQPTSFHCTEEETEILGWWGFHGSQGGRGGNGAGETDVRAQNTGKMAPGGLHVSGSSCTA